MTATAASSPYHRLAPAALTPLALALALAAGGAIPPAARADCGGVQRAAPARRVAYLPPLAVGDSTMLLALPNLAARGFQVNAHGCRQFPEALDLLRRLARGRILPHLVVIALGADGSVTSDDVRRSLAILGPRRVLALVTPRELGGGSGADAATVRAAGRAYPGRVRVLDWVAAAAGHGDWFQPDGLHLTFPGAAAFARLLGQALPLAPPGPATPPAPARCPTRPAAGAGAGFAAGAPGLAFVLAGGVLATTAGDPGAVRLGLVNANRFPVVGSLSVAPIDATGAPVGPAATVCVALAASGLQDVRLPLGPGLAHLLAVTRRFPVRLSLRVHDAAGAGALVTEIHRLERPARGPRAPGGG